MSLEGHAKPLYGELELEIGIQRERERESYARGKKMVVV